MAVVLVDCDNFFASCERVFQPELCSKPVAVLSNNDGCVIARTNEVKRAGVTMGQPYHECRQVLEAINAHVVSANFLLYRHFAKRIQTILRSLPASSVQVYSIDESFIEIPDSTFVLGAEHWANQLQALILQWTGLPVSIGVAPSKALAKVAVHIAKQQGAACSLLELSSTQTQTILKTIPIHEVWGVGYRMAPQFRACGITTAYDLVSLSATSPQLKLLNKTSSALVGELKGWQSSEVPTSSRKTILHSRSFGTVLTNENSVRAALSEFSTAVAAKLRRLGLVTGHMSVFIRIRDPRADRHGKALYAESPLAPTNDTFALECAAEQLLQHLFKNGMRVVKGGILVRQLQSAKNYQLSFATDTETVVKREQLMQAIDTINEAYEIAVKPATAYLGNGDWRGKQQRLSQFTHTSWNSLPIVTA